MSMLMMVMMILQIIEKSAVKMNSVGIALVLLFANFNKFSLAQGWDYGLNGPLRWGALYTTCKGLEQSPININTATAVSSKQSAFVFNYPATADFILKNNGHSVEMRVTSPVATVSGGGLTGNYILEQFHLHWGKSDFAGSEHQLNGKPFSMEIHFVHYSEKYKNVSDAVASGDRRALAVFGVFVNMDYTREPKELGRIADALTSIPFKDNVVTLTGFSALNLFPASKSYFYRYDGSLTTPTCNQVVVWTVFNDPIYIAAEHLQSFRTLRDSIEGEADVFITQNFRPPQALNARTVSKSP
jgi:carbonic anhydrase